MTQVPVHAVAADRRSALRALRPLLLLGGFLAVWWVLMSGIAHADDHHELVGQVRSTAAHTTAKVHAPSRPQARPDRPAPRQHEVKTNIGKTASHLHQQAKQATRTVTHTPAETVTAVTESTPATPVVHDAVRTARKNVTDTVRKALADTVEKTRGLVQDTAAGPAVDAAQDEVSSTVAQTLDSSAQRGSSPSGHADRTLARTSVTGLPSPWLSATLPTAATAGPGQGVGAQATGRDDAPAPGPSGTPAPNDPCTSGSASGSSSSFTPAGLTESSLLVLPAVLADRNVWRLSRRPAGPAYQPGSSPD